MDNGLDIAQWLTMGDYGWFVWPSYAIALIILIWCIAQPLRAYKRHLSAIPTLKSGGSL